jgi:tetratricopeptide (TPR) repeat protein
MSPSSGARAPLPDTGRRNRPSWHAWACRIALAVAVPAAVLLALEGGLRLARYGGPTTFLIPDEKPGTFRTNPGFAGLFLPESFDLRPLNFRISRHKAPNTVRIVVLGESAAKGLPAPNFAFAPQLRAQLRHRFPGTEFEVINTGVAGVNSHAAYRIACELAQFEPDLFAVYMGNNEVVGPYGPGCFYLPQMPPLWLIRASIFVRSTRTGQLLGNVISRITPSGRRYGKWGGMAMFVNNAVAGDDPRLAAVYANFASNLRDITRVASGAGARTVVCTVVANLKDCPPFLSRHRAGLSQSELSSWKAAFDRGRLAWIRGDASRAREKVTSALQIDPQFADTHFMLGSLDLQSGDVPSARAHFVEALHWDALRFRPDAQINRVIREVAREGTRGVSLLDAAEAMGSDPASPGPVSGREMLFEHVHLDWPGNFILARMLARSSAEAIFGHDPGDEGWMDSDACSEALAYTPCARLPMLLQTDALVRAPPFTNQLTHLEDEARLAGEIRAATRASSSPDLMAHAAETARSALARDPDNPDLTVMLEEIEARLGDLNGALALARRADEAFPRVFELAAAEASILTGLGRYTEAEGLLKRAAAAGADLDTQAGAFADFWMRTKRFDEGRPYFAKAIADHPHDLELRFVGAGFMRASGDLSGAEREFRAILAEDSANGDALDALVALLNNSGRADEAAKASAAAVDLQPGNHDNSLRAASYFREKGDSEGMVRALVAAERNGPVDSAIELELAFDLFKLKRADESMSHLVEARRLSVYEGNASVTDSIDRLIGGRQPEPERPPP